MNEKTQVTGNCLYSKIEYFYYNNRIIRLFEAMGICPTGDGMPGASRYDEYVRIMDFMQAKVDADESTTVGGHIEALDEVRFNRKKINCRLADLSV